MTLPRHVLKWWDIANDRRQKLINRNAIKGGLTPRQKAEFKMLQNIADQVMTFAATAWCKRCGEVLGVRDLGWFPAHSCKRKSR